MTWHSKRQKKNIEKTEKQNKKNKTKKQQSSKNNNLFVTFAILHRKILILLENIFAKTQFISLRLRYRFFMWQVIENAVKRQQSQ